MLGLKKHTLSLPVLDIADIIDQTAAYTPDVAALESRVFNFVFVADECMVGHRKHDLVSGGASGSTPFYPCYTADKFSYLVKTVGEGQHRQLTPLPFREINNGELPVWMQNNHRVRGELYALRGCSIIELDNYKQNGVVYDRKEVNVNIPYFKRKVIRSQTYNGVWSTDYQRSKDYIVTIKAWMYVARPEYWLDQLLDRGGCFNFRPVPIDKVDRIWIKEFYNFPRQF